MEAFEKFASCRLDPVADGLPRVKGCPMCRRWDYEKRLIFDGERSYRVRCVVRIQALWRGHVVRRMFKKLLLDMTMPLEPGPRRRCYFERKVSHLTDMETEAAAKTSVAVDALILDVNSTLAESRRVMREATALIASNVAAGSKSSTATTVAKTDDNPPSLWQHAARLALKRCSSGDGYDCAVCMMSLPKLMAGKSRGSHGDNVFLLSCSHVFHGTCLVAVETYACSSIPRCPVCRAAYLRISWNQIPLGVYQTE